jgi:calcineurin-like phosphoesterase family protein
MTDDMIKRHNAKVAFDDDVYHLGDYAFGSTAFVLQCLRRMNGNFKFIWGNHDDNLKQVAGIINLYPDLKDRVKFLGDYHETRIDGQDVVLMHYAMRVWNSSHRGVWQLYGHSHGSLPDDPHAQNFDCGVDCHNLEPISFDEVKAIMAKKLWKPIDHHGRQDGGGLGMTPAQYAKAERKKLYFQLQKEFEKETNS